MPAGQTGLDDVTFDLISVQYHALAPADGGDGGRTTAQSSSPAVRRCW